jgi:diacylglycerol kinase family enzyme
VELEILTTEAKGDALEFVKNHSLQEVDALLTIGGDGTVHEVINGMMKREVPCEIPLGILPSGTGNSLMTDMGSETVQQATQDFFSGVRFRMDLMEISIDGEIRYGFNLIGCGLPSAVNAYAEASRACKSQRYNVGVLKALIRYQKVGYTLEVNDPELNLSSDFIIISNTRHIGNGICIAPHARLDDGKLDLIYLTSCSRVSLLPLFRKLIKGTHLEEEQVYSEQVTSINLSAPSRQEINIDGEQIGFHELQATVRPHCITLLHSPTSKEVSV